MVWEHEIRTSNRSQRMIANLTKERIVVKRVEGINKRAVKIVWGNLNEEFFKRILNTHQGHFSPVSYLYNFQNKAKAMNNHPIHLHSDDLIS